MSTVTLHGRILFLLDDATCMRRQLAGEDLALDDVRHLLRDDVSTDEITPAWACYHHDETLGDYPYVGLVASGELPVTRAAVRAGGFAVSVSGARRGKGSSREASPFAERAAGIRLVIARSFERIYRENCRNLGVFTSTDFGLVARVRAGEAIPLAELLRDEGPTGRAIATAGGLLPFAHARLANDGVAGGDLVSPHADVPMRPLTLGEKILHAHRVSARDGALADAGDTGDAGDDLVVRADLRFSHEYVTPMAATFFEGEFGVDARVADPASVLCFRDHLTLLADAMTPEHLEAGLLDVALSLETKQRTFAERQGIRLYGDRHASEAICHAKVLESYALPGQVIVGTDSHTPHAGAVGCIAFGVGTTAMAAAWATRDVLVSMPPAARVVFRNTLAPGVTAKDAMLELLRHPWVRSGAALGHLIEYQGEAVAAMDVDERATLCNMAAEVGAFSALVAPDARTAAWLAERRGFAGEVATAALGTGLASDAGAAWAVTVEIDAAGIRPMLALPGDPGNGIALDELPAPVAIDIAYAGSCTAGKRADMDMYAAVFAEARARGARVHPRVRCLVQCGSREVWDYCLGRGYDRVFADVGAVLVRPSCGACINAGPGVSRRADEVTVSAINRNYPGRSGPGRLYLASPCTVAASAIAGHIAAWDPSGAGVTARASLAPAAA